MFLTVDRHLHFSRVNDWVTAKRRAEREERAQARALEAQATAELNARHEVCCLRF